METKWEQYCHGATQAMRQTLNTGRDYWRPSGRASHEKPGRLDQAQPNDTSDTTGQGAISGQLSTCITSPVNQDDEQPAVHPTPFTRTICTATGATDVIAPTKYAKLTPVTIPAVSDHIDHEDSTEKISVPPTMAGEDSTEAQVGQYAPTATDTTLEIPEQQDSVATPEARARRHTMQSGWRGVFTGYWLIPEQQAKVARVFEQHCKHIQKSYRQGHSERQPVPGQNIPLEQRIDQHRFHRKHGPPVHGKDVLDDIGLVFRLVIDKIKEQHYAKRCSTLPRGIESPTLFHRQHALPFARSAPGPWLTLSLPQKAMHLKGWLFSKFTLDKDRKHMMPETEQKLIARNQICWTGFWMTDGELDRFVKEIRKEYGELTGDGASNTTD